MKFIQNSKYYIILSGLLIICSLYSIFLIKPDIGIDFTGGSLLEVKFSKPVTTEEIKEYSEGAGVEMVSITKTGEGSIIIRTKDLSESNKNKYLEKIKSKIGDGVGSEEKKFEKIGPTVSSDLISKAIQSIIFASLAIIIYIAYAFRKLPDKNLSWRFGTTAVVALIHDVIITSGLFIIIGKYYGWEIDSLFITALLTVMGFSVHDTIVVFDRLRENLIKNQADNFINIANSSIAQTLARSINTSFTMLIVLATMFFLGGSSLQGFIFTLFFGIFVGTYSSILIATPIVTFWQNKIKK